MKITLCSIAINSWYREIVKYSIKRMETYCKKHGYNFVLLTEDSSLVYDKLKHPAWYKMQLINHLIEKNESEYIVWMDADSMILNMEQKLEYFIEKYLVNTSKQLSLVRERPLNTGIMLIRSSEYNYNLMNEIWNNKNEYDRNFWDQASLVEIYERDETVRNNIEVINYGVQDELVCYWGAYYPGKSFIIHLARCAFDPLGFMYMMDVYYPDKLDEESEEQYLKRYEFLTNESVCRGIINKFLSNIYCPRDYSQRCLNYINSKYLIHWFPFCSGGLCDRLLGLSANLCIARVLNRKILIKWDDTILKPNVEINQMYDYYTHNPSHNYINLSNFQYKEYFKTKDIISEWKDQNIMLWSSLNLYNSLLENPHFKHLSERDYIKDMSESIREVLFKYLKLNPDLFENYKQYDIGIHIRTGDKQIYNKDNEEFYREYITDIFKKIKNEGSIKDNKTVFISSDCLLTYKIAKEFFKNIEFTPGEIVHTAMEDKLTDKGVYKVLLDLLTLCNCKDMLYLGWHSNFSRIAALFNPHRKFVCYEYDNDPKILKEVDIDVLFKYHSYGKYT